jgi:hypothetical protein
MAASGIWMVFLRETNEARLDELRGYVFVPEWHIFLAVFGYHQLV